GGAPEIAASAKQVFIIIRQSRRSFVPALDFITTVGHLDGGDARQRAGLPGAGPTVVVTDLCVMEPDPVTRELTVTALHPGS
ncbi:MAG: CoA-transferase subunit beta, partial [Xanthomonas perforans]|nr:CoA-transferase subunit beta [Xanthomonas perforans]